jgi:hypothetical protein
MTNRTDEDFEARLRAALQADAARATLDPLDPLTRSSRAAPAGAGRRPKRRLRLAVAGGLAVVTAAALSAGLSLAGGSQAPVGAPVTAAELLARVAAASVAQPVPRDDQYIYTEATGIGPAGPADSGKSIRYTTWTWASVDGKTGYLINQKPCQRVPGGTDGSPLTCGYRMMAIGTAFRLPNGSIGEMGGFHFKLPKGAVPIATLPRSYAAARELPTSARQLGTYLKNLPQNPGYSPPIWEQLTTLLEFVPVLPPKVAEAVFTLASQQPGITLLRHVTDAAGRPGIGISQAGDPSHVQLIFNPVTYQLEGINVSGSDLLITPMVPVDGARSMAILHAAIVNSEPSS